MQRWSLISFFVTRDKLFFCFRSEFPEDYSSRDPQEDLDLSFDSDGLYEKEEVYKKPIPLFKQEK